MGHYDENRKFDDEWRVSGGRRDEVPHSVQQMSEWWTSMTADPKESKIKKVKFEVQVPTEVLSYSTLHSWADGMKWICDTRSAFDHTQRPPGVSSVNTTIEGVADFIKEYPHPVGTFYVIADHKEVVKLIIDNPERHIIHLLVE